jgi:hypothetical protein
VGFDPTGWGFVRLLARDGKADVPGRLDESLEIVPGGDEEGSIRGEPGVLKATWSLGVGETRVAPDPGRKAGMFVVLGALSRRSGTGARPIDYPWG